MSGTSFRSPEGNAKAICEPPVCTANWHTCPAGAAHRNVTVCCASVCWAFAAVAKQISAPASAVDKSNFRIVPSLFLHHPFGAHVLQVHGDGVNDLVVQVRLAIFDDEMLEFAALLVVH